jgi:Fur family transcriptional regulator, ferric uptake regulator
MPVMTPPWSEHARATLNRAGRHKGAARDAVIDLLAAEPCALSAQGIEDKLRRRRRPASRASIYRVLELLQAHGLVQRLEVGAGPAVYELVDPAGDHHHHLVCGECGQLVPFDDPRLEHAIAGIRGRLGFRVDEHEVVLRGACARCRR